MTERLRELVARLGGSYHGSYALLPGPGHSRNDRSLSVKEGAEGRIVYYSHADDSHRDVQAYLGVPTGAPLRDVKSPSLPPTLTAEAKSKLAFCQSVWRNSQVLSKQDPAGIYLLSRGVWSDASTLRYHPACPLGYESERQLPAMIGLVQDRAGAGMGLHATFLQPDGSGKARLETPRRMFGFTAGGAIRLSEISAIGDLGICEGIETSLSFTSLHDVPTWAVLSAGGIRRFEPPRGIRKLYIGADADDRGVSLLAAKELVKRCERRFESVIATAPWGRDWNDVLQERARG